MLPFLPPRLSPSRPSPPLRADQRSPCRGTPLSQPTDECEVEPNRAADTPQKYLPSMRAQIGRDRQVLLHRAPNELLGALPPELPAQARPTGSARNLGQGTRGFQSSPSDRLFIHHLRFKPIVSLRRTARYPSSLGGWISLRLLFGPAKTESSSLQTWMLPQADAAASGDDHRTRIRHGAGSSSPGISRMSIHHWQTRGQ